MKIGVSTACYYPLETELSLKEVGKAGIDTTEIFFNASIELEQNFVDELKSIKDYSFIVLDPPRKGCSKEVIDTIINVKPKNILYISCGPATLARDLGYLKDYYTINFIKPFDMFPQTHHVETLVSLTLKD